ncbi:Rid family hydrolase [Nocardioides sp. CFH 31398]|uniref:Rid family hydrolase n=1 Tax=Nocardioides sp. CFH 31398 TaxID=2919579 RepID=UPI001F070AC9|nr:Rid family hydrolase [Nocardioides sp. CFH 31398]MCH1867550.1 Rid family hydrolase [Nocardioides sp. CFH 31398]
MDHLLSPAHAALGAQWAFSDVVAASGLLLCSGVTGARPDGNVDDDPATQFETAFAHLGRALALAGATTADVVELTTYHVGLREHLETFAAVKARHVAAPYPAWSAIGVAELAVPGTLVELRAVARDPRSR